MRFFKLFLLLPVLALSCASWAAADEITSNAPALPDMAGNGSAPDLPLPSLDLPGLAPQSTPLTAAVSTAVPTAAPTTVPQEAASTATAVPAAPTSTPDTAAASTPVAAASTAAPASAESPDQSGATLEGLEAYFPIRTGARWNYQSSAGKTRVVECLSRDGEGATLSGQFRVTTGAVPITETWKLSGGKVVLAAPLTTLRAGWVRLVTPQGKTVPRWTYDRRDGTVSYYKQEAGPVQAGGKKYAEGLTVTERTLKGSAQVSLRKWYYAKGIGLVAEAAFDTTGATLPGQTFDLSAPSSNSP